MNAANFRAYWLFTLKLEARPCNAIIPVSWWQTLNLPFPAVSLFMKKLPLMKLGEVLLLPHLPTSQFQFEELSVLEWSWSFFKLVIPYLQTCTSYILVITSWRPCVCFLIAKVLLAQIHFISTWKMKKQWIIIVIKLCVENLANIKIQIVF